MSETEPWVLVGTGRTGPVKVFGPFDDPDEARDLCNGLGVPGIAWQVVPLVDPVPVEVD